MTLALTDQDMVDLRRHAGYGALGSSANRSLMYFRYWPEYQALEFRVNNLQDEEIIYLQGQLLPFLNQLEKDVYGVRANLDTDKAAVWTHNRDETIDRIDLYNYHRKLLCSFMQLPPGPFFVTNSASGFRFIH